MEDLVTVPAVAVAGACYTYPDGRLAVADVSLRLDPGDSLGLIGPNGAGKTTLFHLIAGLLVPERGTIEVFGTRYGAGDDRQVRRRLGLVFQETEDQLFSPRLFDDVAFGPLNFGLPAAEVRARVEDALRKAGLDGFEDRVPHHLSCGERRRAALATVLSYSPDVLILDEPSNDLDPRGRQELVRLLRRMGEARLVASHDIELVLRTCGRVAIMDMGRIVASGATAEVLSDRSLLQAHGLELPLGLRGLGAAELERLLEGDA
ncbi:MAG: ABC transporter ATP-binding protein [Planctomycetes bacterium]|nr:ABC transporter ATP-binding protein [Planctomycetota bacterium]